MNSTSQKHLPRLIAWEVTRRCYLKCKHCRAAAVDERYQNELTTDEMKRTLENIAAFSKPIIILTGGEPMTRDDIYDIAAYGNSLGLRMVMAPCGRLVNAESVARMKEAGIKRISLSIDGENEASHDEFRGLAGSWGDVIKAACVAKECGMPFQINTTVTKSNVTELPNILKRAKDLGAVSFHPFLLVPTGRGKDLTGLELSPREYEETLNAVHEMSKEADIHVKPTCAPHYFRIARQKGDVPRPSHGHGHSGGLDAATRGCLGGTGFAFISHTGVVQICGFLDVPCGDVRETNYDFETIWKSSPVFLKMRDQHAYKGKCGPCEFHDVCGGCRARAYAMTGDYLKPEPYCVYVPGKKTNDETILTNLQDDLPIAPRLFATLAQEFGLTEDELLNKVSAWHEEGLIRHLSAHVDDKRLGFDGALVAIKVSADMVDSATRAIAAHPGVSHCYLRKHDYNIWFTIKVPGDCSLEKHVQQIAQSTSANDFLILSSTKTFKLNVKFDAATKRNVGSERPRKGDTAELDLSSDDWVIVDALNRGLPIDLSPFVGLASELNMDEEALCQKIAELKEKGAFGKLRFVLHHGRLGVKANAMVVWDVDEKRVDEVGAYFAEKNFISHCYCRTRHESFPYNFYTMIHADNRAELDEIVATMAQDIGSPSRCALTTERELIKRKATIVRDEYRRWEEGLREILHRD